MGRGEGGGGVWCNGDIQCHCVVGHGGYFIKGEWGYVIKVNHGGFFWCVVIYNVIVLFGYAVL